MSFISSLVSSVKTALQISSSQTNKQASASSPRRTESVHGKSAANISHLLKQRGGDGGMAQGITNTQRKGFMQGLNVGKKMNTDGK